MILPRTRRYLQLLSCLSILACGEKTEGSRPLPGKSLEELVAQAQQRNGNGIGKTIEGRFLDEAKYVLLLDEYQPHLNLFSVDGYPVWSGGRSGGGPTEYDAPQALATYQDQVLVFQSGRVTRLHLESDTLAFEESIPIPANLWPYGAVHACEEGDNWLLYARSDDQILVSPEEARQIPKLNYLFSLDFSGSGAPKIQPIWSEDRDLDALQVLGHHATRIDRVGDHIVVLHRSSARKEGRMLEFSCGGELIRSHSEHAIAVGDSLEVQLPRPRAMEWTTGIAALPDGFVTLQQRYYSKRWDGVPESHWRSEVFRFEGGEYLGSVALDRQWVILDYDQNQGVLMASNHPFPLFITIPLADLMGN